MSAAEQRQSVKSVAVFADVASVYDRDLYNRIFEFTNKHTDYGLELPGQEGFTIIQYNPDDEYQ